MKRIFRALPKFVYAAQPLLVVLCLSAMFLDRAYNKLIVALPPTSTAGYIARLAAAYVTAVRPDRAMKVPNYQVVDRSSLVSLWTTVFPDNPPHNESQSAIYAKLAADNLIFVAKCDDKIVGACIAGYDGEHGSLYAVAVLDESRRTGVGVKLVSSAIRALKGGRLPQSQSANSFYKHSGSIALQIFGVCCREAPEYGHFDVEAGIIKYR